MSRRDLGISVGRISSWKSHIPMSKEAEGDTHVIVDTNRQVQAWGGVEGVGRGGGVAEAKGFAKGGRQYQMSQKGQGQRGRNEQYSVSLKRKLKNIALLVTLT